MRNTLVDRTAVRRRVDAPERAPRRGTMTAPVENRVHRPSVRNPSRSRRPSAPAERDDLTRDIPVVELAIPAALVPAVRADLQRERSAARRAARSVERVGAPPRQVPQPVRAGAPQPVPTARILRRRRRALGVLVGAGLALGVWVFATIGGDYAASVAPQPIGTEVIQVHQGESLNLIANRIAPDLPLQTVVDEIVELNDLPASGLQTGQSLVAPVYP